MFKLISLLLCLALLLCGCSAIFTPPTRPSDSAVIEIPNKATTATEATDSTESASATQATEETDPPATESTLPTVPTVPVESTVPDESTTDETTAATAPPEPAETAAPTEPSEEELIQALWTAFQSLRSPESLSAVTLDPALCSLAQIRSEETGSLWGHTRPNQTDFTTVLSDSGYAYLSAAENLHKSSAGYPAQWILDDWLHSQTHKANLLAPAMTHIGIGVYIANGTVYTVFLFVSK